MRGQSDGSFDWTGLQDRAVEAMGHAYAPYSHYPVGAAAMVDDELDARRGAR